MTTLRELLERARRTGDFGPMAEAVPYARFVGLSVEASATGEPITRLRSAPHVVGNALLPALHGGAISALLESAAIFGLLWETREAEVLATPRTISITIEYLRSARTVDTFARAEITRHGRRVAAVHAVAWQDDPAKPVAAANAHFLLKTT
jgi:uncharacterized protein (TIGR00369 family)